MTDKKTDKFFVRGIAPDLAAQVKAAAQADGITMGAWVSRAFARALGLPVNVTDNVTDSTRLEELEARMVKIDEMEARIAALEAHAAGPRAAAPQASPRQPRPPAAKRTAPTGPAKGYGGTPPIPDEILAEAARLRAAGMSAQRIIAEKGWPYHRSSLDRAVKRYLDRQQTEGEPTT